jgi:phage baseplate assembly protein W|tara:strand:+ start:425 stop:877 length:453 start_codon:yes stop_codon:yes gene_type:complete
MSQIEKDLNPDVFIGISLPLDYGDQGFFNKTRTLLQQTRSNIRNLLLTIRGERLGNPTFGSDLMRLLFEPQNEDLEQAIEESIRASMDEWLPFVKIRNIDVIPSSRNPNLINVRLQFSINADETVETINLNLATDDEQANDADLAIFNSV